MTDVAILIKLLERLWTVKVKLTSKQVRRLLNDTAGSDRIIIHNRFEQKNKQHRK